MASLALEVTGVSKRFGGLQALQDVHFGVPEGAVVGVIGPNGSGKTTLFNLCSGMMTPESGRVLLHGVNVTGLRPFQVCRLGLGRTFQIVRPFAEVTVLDNVITGALFGGGHSNSGQARREALEILAFLKLDRKAHLLSGALTLPEKKKLEVARVLATKPKVLLLDEVMAGLTPTEVDGFVDLVRRVNQRGVSIVIIEHVLRAVMDLAERIVVLHHGKVIADDSPEHVVADPAVIESYLGEEFGNAARG